MIENNEEEIRDIKHSIVTNDLSYNSDDVKIAKKDVKIKKSDLVKSEPKFRLSMYRNGMVRSDISKNVLRDMSAKYGDIMRAVSSNTWMTIDEIVENYWDIERRLKFEMGRTRKKIEQAITELVENEFITVKE